MGEVDNAVAEFFIRLDEGRTQNEAVRCLKRYTARGDVAAFELLVERHQADLLQVQLLLNVFNGFQMSEMNRVESAAQQTYFFIFFQARHEQS